MLAVPPQRVQIVLAELSFRPEHVVMSAAAGVHLHPLQEWAAPASDVVRGIPLPQAAHRQSLTTIYPDDSVTRELFDRVGGVLVLGTEAAFEAFSAATATFAAHPDYLSTIATWLAEHGVNHDTATESWPAYPVSLDSRSPWEIGGMRGGIPHWDHRTRSHARSLGSMPLPM
ncbi:MAG: hypothetical protein L0K86_16785 [Actinomycetia bacterium]|nr:hypothetical protein [Actinomycetes bacterium]